MICWYENLHDIYPTRGQYIEDCVNTNKELSVCYDCIFEKELC